MDKKDFLTDLVEYMVSLGKPIGKSPVMGYKELDLHQLFCEVLVYGGFHEVVNKVGTWAKIWKRLDNFDASITDASYRLRKNYEKCLLDYEYKYFPENRDKYSPSSPRSPAKKEPHSPISLSPSGSSADLTSLAKDVQATAPVDSFTVERDANGQVVLPLDLGEFVIENFGTIIPRAPFVTHKHIWPVGYKCSKMFHSMQDPSMQVKYTSQIIDGGGKPMFMITPSDDPNSPILSTSPSQVWRTVIKRALGSKAADFQRGNISGSQYFGMGHAFVKELIRKLPDSDKALQYKASLGRSVKNKKRKLTNDHAADKTIEDHEALDDLPRKITKLDTPNSPTQFCSSQDEMEDLEAAVTTLCSLKFSLSITVN